MRTLLSLSIILSFSGVSLRAQEGPSYEETVQFISEKVSIEFPETGHDRYRFIESSRCTFRYEMTEAAAGGGLWVSYLEAPFNELDPTRVTVEDRGNGISVVVIPIRQGNPLRHWVYTTIPEGGQDNSSQYDMDALWFKTNNGSVNAPKVARAVVHLIELCGGEGELF